MITDCKDKKITPKQKAQDLIMDQIAICRGYWCDDEYKIEGMTKKEIEKVDIQLKKLADRIAKKMGYEESWKG